MRRLQLASLVAIAAAMAFAETAAAADLTITSWGGAYQTSQRKAYYEHGADAAIFSLALCGGAEDDGAALARRQA